MKVVLDTNVLVAGLLNPYYAPGQIVSMASSGALVLCYDTRVISEYKEVLSRPKFSFNQNHVNDLIQFFQSNGEAVVPKPLKSRLPDVHDEMFLEVAAASSASCLITGNSKHYPLSKQQGVKVVSPSGFIEFYRKES